MLVLSRNRGESIVFPELNIEVKILDIRENGAVRVGIQAPRRITVNRGEVQKAIEILEENKAD
tara:strand:+ start:7330 stop:7518 length:189 start_codon:yes stop_codon:yes gene_type:complete